MANQIHKTETIRRIEHLQLPAALIFSLDDAHKAESIVEAIQSLQHLIEHWN